MTTKFKTVKQKVIISASPQEVYDAYIDPKKRSEFTGYKATGKPVVGGKFTGIDGHIYGKLLELEDGKRVVLEWTSTDYDYGPSKLELCFNKVPAGTELDIVISDVPEDQADEDADAWTEYWWDPLKKYFSDKSKA